MKKLVILSLCALTLTALKCGDKATPDPTPTVPPHQAAIDAKFKSLGWDTDGHAPLNGSGPVKTASGKGYVQYYAFGNGKSAIYYSPEKGAFGMNTVETNAYEVAGQDKLATVVSDPKPCGTGCSYNDIIKVLDNAEGILLTDKLVYGEIYKKYQALNRWDGILGLPVTSELNLRSGKGRYNAFKGGQIYWSIPTGPQAFWGKVEKLYAATDYDKGWLGLPTESCDPAKKDDKQNVGFQNGRIGVTVNGTCGNYYSSSGLLTNNKGIATAFPPCY